MKRLLSWFSGCFQYNYEAPYKRRQEIRGGEGKVVMEPVIGVMWPLGKEGGSLWTIEEAKG